MPLTKKSQPPPTEVELGSVNVEPKSIEPTRRSRGYVESPLGSVVRRSETKVDVDEDDLDAVFDLEEATTGEASFAAGDDEKEPDVEKGARSRARRFSVGLGAFPPDCGPQDGAKHLSYRKALLWSNLTHPRQRKLLSKGHDTRVAYYKYPIRKTPFGSHFSKTQGILKPYGPGVQLYFQWLKAMVWLFWILTILSIPAFVFYFAGGDREDYSFDLESLKITTLGNLGEGDYVCATLEPGESVQLQCAAGRLLQVIPHYGTPTGHCQCPDARLPTSTGLCEVDGVCQNELYCYKGEFNSLDCCDDSRHTDFSDLAVRDDSTCESISAEYAVRGVCMDQTSCTITASHERVFTWVPDSTYSTHCPDEAYYNGTHCSMTMIDPVGGVTGLEECTVDPSDFRLIVEGRCYVTDIDFAGQTYDKNDIATLVSLIDTFASLAVLLFFRTVRKKELRQVHLSDMTTITPADYTLIIPRLPKHRSTKELKQQLIDHLETVLSGYKQIGPKRVDRIRISAIHFGLANNGILALYKERGDFSKDVDRALSKLEKLYSLMEAAKTERAVLKYQKRADKYARRRVARLGKKFVKIERRIEKAQSEYKKIDKEAVLLSIGKDGQDVRAAFKALEEGSEDSRAVCAYVTFEEEEGIMRALHCYPNSLLARLFQKRAKRLNGFPIVMEHAPEPTNIIWENLGVPRRWRVLAQMMTALIAAALLAASFILMYQAKMIQQEMEAEYPPVTCPESTTLEDVWMSEYGWRPENTTGVIVNEGALECYCLAEVKDSGYKALSDLTFDNPRTEDVVEEDSLCVDWLVEYFRVRGLTVGAAVMVVVINLILRVILRRLVKVERHRSKSNENASLVFKLFLAQIVNTGFLVLVVNANLDFFVESDSAGGVLFFSGDYDDFSEDWYARVGTSLLLVMFMNILSPHVAPLVALFKAKRARYLDRDRTHNHSISNCITQRELEELYTGPEFEIAERYAVGLNTLFVTFMFASGLPLLYPMAAFAFFLSYWVDKITFLRLYRNPPFLTDAVARVAAKIMPLAVVFHLAFGLWMYSNENIIPRKSVTDVSTSEVESSDLESGAIGDLQDRMSSEHVIPLLCALVLLLALMLIRFNYRFIRLLLPFLNCSGDDDYVYENLPNYYDSLPGPVLGGLLTQKSFERHWARIRQALDFRSRHPTAREMQGVCTYSMLDIPEYRQLFAADVVATIRKTLPKLEEMELHGKKRSTASIRRLRDKMKRKGSTDTPVDDFDDADYSDNVGGQASAGTSAPGSPAPGTSAAATAVVAQASSAESPGSPVGGGSTNPTPTPEAESAADGAAGDAAAAGASGVGSTIVSEVATAAGATAAASEGPATDTGAGNNDGDAASRSGGPVSARKTEEDGGNSKAEGKQIHVAVEAAPEETVTPTASRAVVAPEDGVSDAAPPQKHSPKAPSPPLGTISHRIPHVDATEAEAAAGGRVIVAGVVPSADEDPRPRQPVEAASSMPVGEEIRPLPPKLSPDTNADKRRKTKTDKRAGKAERHAERERVRAERRERRAKRDANRSSATAEAGASPSPASPAAPDGGRNGAMPGSVE